MAVYLISRPKFFFVHFKANIMPGLYGRGVLYISQFIKQLLIWSQEIL